MATGKASEALVEFEKTQSTYERHRDPMGIAGALMNRGLALFDLGRIEEAILLLQRAHSAFDIELNMRFEAARAATSLGWAYLKLADSIAQNSETALKFFKRAIETFEKWRLLLNSTENRQTFFETCARAYDGAVLASIGAGRYLEGFAFLEGSFSRVLTESVEADLRCSAADVGDELFAEWIQIRTRRMRAGLVTSLQDVTAMAGLRPAARERVDSGSKAEEFISWAERVQQQRPECTLAKSLRDRPVDDGPDPPQALGDDRSCVLEFFAGSPNDQLLAFLLTRNAGLQLVTFPIGSLTQLRGVWQRWVSLYDCFTLIDPGILVSSACKDLHHHIFGAQVQIETEGEDSARPRRTSVLVEAMREQVRASEDSPGRLYLIPHRFLGMLPLHGASETKTDGTLRPLIKHFAVSYAPGFRLLAMGMERTPSKSKRALVIGNPLSAAHVSLPGAEREAEATAAKLTASGWEVTCLLREQATKKMFLEGDGDTVAGLASGAYTHLHLAQHASFSFGRVSVSQQLQFADDLDAPEDTSCGPQDIESCPLRELDCGMVAVCSGAATHPWMTERMGLGAAFLKAGARTVISALYPLADHSSERLIDDVYKNRLNEDISWAEALRRAQLKALSRPLDQENAYV